MSIPSAQTVTIGAGGTGGASPTAGGDTSIGSLLVAKGGANAISGAPATGGTTPTGCFRIQGGRSGGGLAGCTGSTFLSPSVETNYSVTLPQDGHGGASTSNSYTQRNGGAGVVIIMW